MPARVESRNKSLFGPAESAVVLRPLLTGILVAAAIMHPGTAVADKADVEAVEVVREADSSYRFDVTVRHADTGWEHYADGWVIVGEDGAVLGTRELLHPHVDEQPFTRSLSGVAVPAGVGNVIVRARDKVHGFGGREMRVQLPER